MGKGEGKGAMQFQIVRYANLSFLSCTPLANFPCADSNKAAKEPPPGDDSHVDAVGDAYIKHYQAKEEGNNAMLCYILLVPVCCFFVPK